MRTIIAIDPGRLKCGIAILTEDGRLLAKAIKVTEDVAEYCLSKVEEYKVDFIVLGDGTQSEEVQLNIEEFMKAKRIDLPLTTIDERYTTEMGIIRYWKYNPPKGWRKLFPVSWQEPPTPVDDYVAWIIGERFFGNEYPEPLDHVLK